MAKAKKTTSSNRLLEAIQFLSSVTKDEGAPQETHILLNNRTATAFNGILAAGVLIEEDIYCAPHNDTLITALKKCSNNPYSIIQDGLKLTIKSGKFRAMVPCIDPSLLSFPIPDNICASIDDRLRDGLAILEVIKTDNAQRVVSQSVLLNGQSLIATDGKIIVEYWHGIDLPSGLAIPKAFIPAITKANKKLTGFGYSNYSVTLYFEDNSWIRSQLYAEAWPSLNHLLDKPCNPVEVPKGLWEAVDAVEPFSEHGTVYFNKGLLQSHNDALKGATYEVEGLPEGPAYATKYLDIIQSIATKVDFCIKADNSNGYLAIFYGERTRGIMAGVGR